MVSFLCVSGQDPSTLRPMTEKWRSIAITLLGDTSMWTVKATYWRGAVLFHTYINTSSVGDI